MARHPRTPPAPPAQEPAPRLRTRAEALAARTPPATAHGAAPPAVEPPVPHPTAGRPAVAAEPARATVLAVATAYEREVDDLINDLRTRLGLGFFVVVAAPSSLHPMVCVSWNRLRDLEEGRKVERRVIKSTLRAALLHVVQFEDIVDRDGVEAARRWHEADRDADENVVRRVIAENEKLRAKGAL